MGVCVANAKEANTEPLQPLEKKVLFRSTTIDKSIVKSSSCLISFMSPRRRLKTVTFLANYSSDQVTFVTYSILYNLLFFFLFLLIHRFLRHISIERARKHKIIDSYTCLKAKEHCVYVNAIDSGRWMISLTNSDKVSKKFSANVLAPLYCFFTHQPYFSNCAKATLV